MPQIVQYLVAGSRDGGMMFLLQVPLIGKPGKRKREMPWSVFRKAFFDVLKSHDIKIKDLSFLEPQMSAEDWDPGTDPYPMKNRQAYEERMIKDAEGYDNTFSTGKGLNKFWLYRWEGGREGKLMLVRGAIE